MNLLQAYMSTSRETLLMANADNESQEINLEYLKLYEDEDKVNDEYYNIQPHEAVLFSRKSIHVADGDILKIEPDMYHQCVDTKMLYKYLEDQTSKESSIMYILELFHERTASAGLNLFLKNNRSQISLNLD
eukprot:SAG31_NODE_1569_length_7855_cov_13.073234_3_plen_132_part_00